MNHEKKKAYGREWPGKNSSCKRKGRQVRGKPVQVCIWLNSLLRGVMRVVKANLYLEKSPLKSIKRSKVKRGFKKIQGREKSFPSYGRVKMRTVSSKRPFVKLYDNYLVLALIICTGTKVAPIISSLIRVRNSTWQWIFETLWLRTGTNTQPKLVWGNMKNIYIFISH